MGACLGRSPDEDDNDCSDCVDVFVRTERLARAAFVFSRAIAAIESLLCLAWWPVAEVLLSGSRDDVGRKDGGDWRWVVEGYGWEGLSMCSESELIRALVDEGSVRIADEKQQ